MSADRKLGAVPSAEIRRRVGTSIPYERWGLLGLTPIETRRYMPEYLQRQLATTIDLYRGYNSLLPPDSLQKPPRALDYAEHYLASFIVDRNQRAEDVQDPRYQREAVEKAASLLPMPFDYLDCMDGRIKPVITNGLTAEMVDAIRTPGGLLSEFVRVDGKLKLVEGSNYAKRLLAKRQSNPYFAQIFDSHLACAARTTEEGATGNHPDDAGLRRDILQKREMISAIEEFLRENPDSGHEMVPVQTSYNPQTGFMYMGLETEYALKYSQDCAVEMARENGVVDSEQLAEAAQYSEYTKNIIKELVTQGKLVSTGAIIQNPQIRSAFEAHWFEIDREDDYVESSIKFIEKLETLLPELSPIFEQEVLKVYPSLALKDEKSQRELKTRVFLLLSNAFNGYLQNNNFDVWKFLDTPSDEYQRNNPFRYSLHDEGAVLWGDGGSPPYKYTVFVIDPRDTAKGPPRVEYASGITRGNRSAGRVEDDSGNYRIFTDRENRVFNQNERTSFEKAPVVTIIPEKIDEIPDRDWQRFAMTYWDGRDGMPKNWDTMNPQDFANYLIDVKGISNASLIRGIENLRQKMIRLYDPLEDTSPHLKGLYKVALPLVVDQHGTIRAIVPFLKVGRSNDFSQNGHQQSQALPIVS